MDAPRQYDGPPGGNIDAGLDLDHAVFVALGSNDKGGHASSVALLEAALAGLDSAGLVVIGRSAWWGSKAWPDPSHPPFVNGVARIRTSLSPQRVLAVLHDLEAEFGRRRTAVNAPRTLDLDLIAHGRAVRASDPALPHPRAAERLFVMGPLAQIAPGWRHPVSGLTALSLARRASVGTDAEPLA